MLVTVSPSVKLISVILIPPYRHVMFLPSSRFLEALKESPKTETRISMINSFRTTNENVAEALVCSQPTARLSHQQVFLASFYNRKMVCETIRPGHGLIVRCWEVLRLEERRTVPERNPWYSACGAQTFRCAAGEEANLHHNYRMVLISQYMWKNALVSSHSKKSSLNPTDIYMYVHRW